VQISSLAPPRFLQIFIFCLLPFLLSTAFAANLEVSPGVSDPKTFLISANERYLGSDEEVLPFTFTRLQSIVEKIAIAAGLQLAKDTSGPADISLVIKIEGKASGANYAWFRGVIPTGKGHYGFKRANVEGQISFQGSSSSWSFKGRSDDEPERQSKLRIFTFKGLYTNEKPDSLLEAAFWNSDLVSVLAGLIAEQVKVEPYELLLVGLQDRSAGIRARAAEALGKLRQKEVVGALEQSLANDKSFHVRGVSAWALGEISDQNSVEALLQATVEGGDADVYELSKEALVKIGGEGLTNRLIAKLDLKGSFRKENEKQVAIDLLGRLGASIAVGKLLKIAKEEENEYIRVEAIQALGKIAVPQSAEGRQVLRGAY